MATTVEQVLAALDVSKASSAKVQKSQALEFLKTFQKSKEAWQQTHSILNSDASAEAKVFAATTLKGKIVYDLDQLPREQVTILRDTVLALCAKYADGPRPIRTQLCVCLANLAIQMTEWKDVLQLVGSTLGNNAGDCVLEFLQVLPEEVIEGRKINLSEEDLQIRSKELLEDNAGNVLQLLITYSASSAQAAQNPHLIECITSWLREIPAASIVRSSLLEVVIGGISNDKTFDSAVDCMSTLFADTKEVDESLEVIKLLFPHVLTLRPKIQQAAEAEDSDALRGLTRIFAEAGEAWVILVARMPGDFRGLVECILECCARDKDKDALSVTFNFWYDLKQYIVLDLYAPALAEFKDIYSKLVDVMIKHLEFPAPESGDEKDLFEGDRELEENFREFRHKMGDVLKDCCSVLEVTVCLQKVFECIKQWVGTYAAQASGTKVPHWQELEAPLFALRAMGRMVSPEENEVLHEVIPLLVQIPDHEKLRFQAIMAIGRYTDWTSQHPDFLQPQLNFVVNSFNHTSLEVVRAAALAFRFFGFDCRKLLRDEVANLHSFYDSVLDRLPNQSQEEITEGAAQVISVQSPDKIYATLKLYCDPIMNRIKAAATHAQQSKDDKDMVDLADKISLVKCFINNVQPYYEPSETNQAVKYCEEICTVFATVAEHFESTPVLESICGCWRAMVIAYRTAILPILPHLASQLQAGFERTHKGCFLFTTDAIVREFGLGAEFVDEATLRAVYSFFEQQAYSFLRVLNDLPPQDLPDVIEDFFHLLVDVLIYFHTQFLTGALCSQILNASASALVLEHAPPLLATLHFLRDFLTYGTDSPASSSFADTPANGTRVAPGQIKDAVRSAVSSQGEEITRRVLTGMMFSFPEDCHQDASGVMLGLFEIMPRETAIWIKNTIDLLPPESVKAGEGERLMNSVADRIQHNDYRKIRVMLKDFCSSYRRRNVAPRDGLGELEARRFRFRG